MRTIICDVHLNWLGYLIGCILPTQEMKKKILSAYIILQFAASGTYRMMNIYCNLEVCKPLIVYTILNAYIIYFIVV